MRFVSATALAFAGALFVAHVHAAPQAMQDNSRKVAGGGIKAPGWQGRVDANEAAKGAKIEDSKVVLQGSEIQINNGPAAIYWNPANKATGSYTVSATFTEPKYMSSNDHPHPYGLFIGGSKLDTDQATLLYCTPYGTGTFIVRGFGPAPFRVTGAGGGRGTAHDSINKAATGASVTQEVAWVVTPEKAECKINGAVVGSYPKADLVGAGKLESLDGIAGLRVAHNVDVNVTNFKLTKQ
jgi:hypothetical protein